MNEETETNNPVMQESQANNSDAITVKFLVHEFSKEQIEILQTQLMAHVQLLTQAVLMTCYDFRIQYVEDGCKKMLREIKSAGDENSKCSPSLFHTCNLDSALEATMKYDSRREEYLKSHKGKNDKRVSCRCSRYHLRPFPELFNDIYLDSMAFPFIQFLPYGVFWICYHGTKKGYLESEYYLIASGLSEIVSDMKFFEITEDQRQRKTFNKDMNTVVNKLIKLYGISSTVKSLSIHLRRLLLRNHNKEKIEDNPFVKFVKTGIVNLPRARKIEFCGTKHLCPLKDITPRFLPKHFHKMVKKYFNAKRIRSKRKSNDSKEINSDSTKPEINMKDENDIKIEDVSFEDQDDISLSNTNFQSRFLSNQEEKMKEDENEVTFQERNMKVENDPLFLGMQEDKDVEDESEITSQESSMKVDNDPLFLGPQSDRDVDTMDENELQQTKAIEDQKENLTNAKLKTFQESSIKVENDPLFLGPHVDKDVDTMDVNEPQTKTFENPTNNKLKSFQESSIKVENDPLFLGPQSDKDVDTMDVNEPQTKTFENTINNNKLRRIKGKDLESLIIEMFLDKVIYEQLGQYKDLCKRLEVTLENNRKKTLHYQREIEDLKKVTRRLQAEHLARKGDLVAPVKVQRSVGIQTTPAIIGKGMMNVSSNSNIRVLSASSSLSSSPSNTTTTWNSNIGSNQGTQQKTVINSAENVTGQQTNGTTQEMDPLFVQPAQNAVQNESASLQTGGLLTVQRTVAVGININQNSPGQFVALNSPSSMGQLLSVPFSDGQSSTCNNIDSIANTNSTTAGVRASGTQNTNLEISSPVCIVNQATRTVQMKESGFIAKVPRHPAPLPKAPPQQDSEYSKKVPPLPMLKLNHKENGVVLYWNMAKTEEHERIASYQIYAYQEGTAAPTPALWKKVGNVNALKLPMACTLTQFTPGHVYHFAVRAVDVKSRLGPFSDPKTIRLGK